MITYDEAHRIFRYDPDSGKLYYRVNRGSQGLAGREVGHLGGGYRRTKIDGTFYFVHRIIWLMTYGEWPEQIDHINHIGDDNRVENLRNVTHRENHLNQSTQKNNTSGVMGVYWHAPGKKWVARINIDGVSTHIGYFDNIFDAACARKSEEIRCGYHQNHGV